MDSIKALKGTQSTDVDQGKSLTESHPSWSTNRLQWERMPQPLYFVSSTAVGPLCLHDKFFLSVTVFTVKHKYFFRRCCLRRVWRMDIQVSQVGLGSGGRFRCLQIAAVTLRWCCSSGELHEMWPKSVSRCSVTIMVFSGHWLAIILSV